MKAFVTGDSAGANHRFKRGTQVVMVTQEATGHGSPTGNTLSWLCRPLDGGSSMWVNDDDLTSIRPIPLIGVIGRKRSGKDTFAGHLVGHYGFTRHAFADTLRNAVLATDPIVDIRRLSELVSDSGWEEAKAHPEVRRLLQTYGVAIRDIDPDFWVRPIVKAVQATWGPSVITDVRFPNEAGVVKALGGVLVRITRPGLDLSDTHTSETALDDYATDFEVHNDQDVDWLRVLADQIISKIE